MSAQAHFELLVRFLVDVSVMQLERLRVAAVRLQTQASPAQEPRASSTTNTTNTVATATATTSVALRRELERHLFSRKTVRPRDDQEG